MLSKNSRIVLATSCLLAACEAVAPTAPGLPLVELVDRTHVSITPQPPPQGQKGVGVRYELRRALQQGGPWTRLTDATMGTPVTDKGPIGAELSYVVVAISGTAEASSPEVLAYTAPGKPLNLRLANVLETGATLAWDGARGVLAWDVFAATTEGQAALGNGTLVAADLTSPQANVSASLATWFVVRARNAAGPGDLSDELAYDPSHPPDPTVLEPPFGEFAGPGATMVHVGWTPPFPRPAWVRVYLDGTPRAEVEGTLAEADVTGLDENTVHSLQLTSLDSSGKESDKSAPLSFRTRRFTRVSGQNDHFCAIDGVGALFCWGSNAKGQLGQGDSSPHWGGMRARVQDAGGQVVDATVREVAVGWNFTCAIQLDGLVTCWGDNTQGQVGDGLSPTGAEVGHPVIDQNGEFLYAQHVGVGRSHACAMKGDESVWCWGDDSYHQLGLGDAYTEGKSTRARQVVGPGGTGFLDRLVELAVGDYNTCVRSHSETTWCWGSQLIEQDTGGATVSATHAVPVQKLGHDATPVGTWRIFNAANTTCVSSLNTTLECWGLKRYTPGNATASGFLVDADVWDPLPTLLPNGEPLLNVDALSWSWRQTCALQADGHAWCWGDNARSQAGGDVQTRPVALTDVLAGPGLGTLFHVASGDGSTCVVDAENRLRCWGRNEAGQCGIVPTTHEQKAVDVALLP